MREPACVQVGHADPRCSLPPQQWPSKLSGCITSQCMSDLDSCLHQASSCTPSASCLPSSSIVGQVSLAVQHSPATSSSTHPNALASSFSTALDLNRIHSHSALPLQQQGGVRFLGQHPEEVECAERALQELRCIQEVEMDLYAGIQKAAMPGVLLDVVKLQKMYSDYFVSQLMPPDFLELCQIAATQQNRCSLFVEQFQ